MLTSFKAVIEDSTRNKFMFYYAGSSICCKVVSKDGVSRDTMIASHVSENFLTAIDLQDNLYIVCMNSDKGLYLYSYINSEWRLEQILNIQGNGNVNLLSLFIYNGTIHIIYAKQMTIANFYNVYHLVKPGSPNSYHLNTTWRKNNVGEIYSEDFITAYSATITKDGVIHAVSEWYDTSNYIINYSFYDPNNDTWQKKPIATLFKKDIAVNILYDENTLHLLCYTFEDEVSALFYYAKKDGSVRDFEFSCLDKVKTEQAVTPYFHTESGTVYVSWILDNKFSQYALNKEQKSWNKKLSSIIPDSDSIQLIEYVRNRRGKALIVKKTYFVIDYKNNISLPYFKDGPVENNESSDIKLPQNTEVDLIRYIPYLLDEIKSISHLLQSINERLEKLENRRTIDIQTKSASISTKSEPEQKNKVQQNVKLKKSGFKDQFMSSNKLLSRPETTALYVGPAEIPKPEELSKKEGIDFVQNELSREEQKKPEKPASPVYKVNAAPKIENDSPANQENDPAVSKEANLFKKIGDFFK